MRSFTNSEATHADDGQPTRCVEVPYTTIEDSTALPPGEEGSSTGRTGVQKFCVDVEWPGASTWNSRQRRGVDKLGPASWMGSLITDQRDASGQLYRRNRYYDPQSGRFTQEDPIGLAGGLNLYGFANGDPVTYSDPYGLCPPEDTDYGPWCSSPLRWVLGKLGVDHEWADGHARRVYETAMVAGSYGSGGMTVVTSRRELARGRAGDNVGMLLRGPTARLDRTGKVHGELPNHIPNTWSTETVEEFGDDLRTSIRTRRNEQLRLGEDGPHRERLRQEERLLRQVEKRLSGS